MRRLRVLTAAVVVLCGTASLRADDNILSLVLRGSYTTSSKIFINPNATSEELRSQFFDLDGISGLGADLRYHFPGESFFVSFSVEYFSKLREENLILGTAGTDHRYPAVDGFTLLPLEFGVYTYIPIGTETARLSMGGGIGVYIGERIVRRAGVDAPLQNNPTSVGIHISSAFEYKVYPGILVRGDMKFRDPELKTINRFTETQTTYEGEVLVLPRNDIAGRINIDGFTFSLGVVVEIF